MARGRGNQVTTATAYTLRNHYTHEDGTPFCINVYGAQAGYVGCVGKYNGNTEWTVYPAFGPGSSRFNKDRGFATPEEAAEYLLA